MSRGLKKQNAEYIINSAISQPKWTKHQVEKAHKNAIMKNTDKAWFTYYEIKREFEDQ